jgi:hypothetical protein
VRWRGTRCPGLVLSALVALPAALAWNVAPPSRAGLVDTTVPAATDSNQWPAGGRFVDAGFADLANLANFVYADHIPPELAPSVFIFQKVAAGGFQAELDFPAPVFQLQYYLNQDSGDEGDATTNGSVRVRYTVDLVLQPQAGDPTIVSLRADGTTVVTRGGAQVGTAKTVFVGTRLIMSVPPSAGVQDSWTVQAVIGLSGDQPLNSTGGGVHLPATLSAATTPALVGVLAGDDAGAPEPLAGQSLLHTAQVAVQSPGTQPLPDGGRPTTVHLEQGAHGLVAVVTLDSPPRPATTSVGGQPVTQEDLQLLLAPGVQDGLGVGLVTVDWPYPACPSSCPMSHTASVTVLGQYIGYLPVTVSGPNVSFDFAGFHGYTPPAQPAQPALSGNVIGNTSRTTTFTAQDLDVAPLGNAPALPPEQTTWAVDGTDISIRRGSESTPATGSVDPTTGYFFASNGQEMWSGFLGKQGWYSRLSDAQATAATQASERGAPPRSRQTVAQLTDILTPHQVEDLAQYLWTEKQNQIWDRVGRTLMFIGFYANHSVLERPNIGSPPPQKFVDAVSQFLAEGGTFDKNTLAKVFPNGYDPIVVAPPPAIPFALASELPGLAPNGAQWEVSVGMKALDRTSLGLRWQSPYVPASSLLSNSPASTSPSTSPSGGSSSHASAPPATVKRGSSGSGSGVIIGVIAAIVAIGGAAVWGVRRRRTSPSEN